MNDYLRVFVSFVSLAIRELYKVKEGPFMSSERSERTQGLTDDTELFYESEDTSSAEQAKVGRLDGEAKAPEKQSTFLQVAEDEYFDAEEPQLWQRGDDLALESSDEMEGSVEEEEPAPDHQVWHFKTLKHLGRSKYINLNVL